jgi:hypothetical protein
VDCSVQPSEVFIVLTQIQLGLLSQALANVDIGSEDSSFDSIDAYGRSE